MSQSGTLEQVIWAYEQSLLRAYDHATKSIASEMMATFSMTEAEAYAETVQLREELKGRLKPAEAKQLETMARQVFAAHASFHQADGTSRSAKQKIEEIGIFLKAVLERET